MVPTTARTAPGYMLTGAIGYAKDEQRPPAMGMGLVARFGSHNAGLFLALQKEQGTERPAVVGHEEALRLLSHPDILRDPKRDDSAADAKWACLTYNSLGHRSDCQAIGLQLDLTA